MAKYSTGEGGGGPGDTCELCGAADVDLQLANVAGAELQVCSDCADHGEPARQSGGDDDSSREGESRSKRAAQNAARIHDAASQDPSHWESGADYEDDQLPYLVSDYGERLTAARQDAGLQIGELAEELDLPESDVLAVEQGRATQAGVGGSTVSALEELLQVDLVESQ
jgi:ribosome-binding protein aMBF1 (putative translation factor)